jgi:signal transduction histidine kinase
MIFCTEELARDSIYEVLYNIPSHRRMGSPHRLRVWCSCLRHDGLVTLHISNDDTARVRSGPVRPGSHGTGLRKMNKRLKAFGAKLDTPPPEDGRTFAVEVTFLEGLTS